MCCTCNGGTEDDPRGTSSTLIEGLGSTGSYALGATLVTIELISWVLFYIGYKKSIAYARYLIDDKEAEYGRYIFDNFNRDLDF